MRKSVSSAVALLIASASASFTNSSTSFDDGLVGVNSVKNNMTVIFDTMSPYSIPFGGIYSQDEYDDAAGGRQETAYLMRKAYKGPEFRTEENPSFLYLLVQQDDKNVASQGLAPSKRMKGKLYGFSDKEVDLDQIDEAKIAGGQDALTKFKSALDSKWTLLLKTFSYGDEDLNEGKAPKIGLIDSANATIQMPPEAFDSMLSEMNEQSNNKAVNFTLNHHDWGVTIKANWNCSSYVYD